MFSLACLGLRLLGKCMDNTLQYYVNTINIEAIHTPGESK